MSRTAPAVLLAALLGTLAGAARPDAGLDPANLVAQLGSPEYQKREAAAKALDALGAAALPALQKALTESNDAELTDRAGDLYERITRRVENARLIAPTTVALDVADAQVVDVLAAVEKQTGYKFFLPTDAVKAVREKKVTVRTDGPEPFWAAVDRVCAAAGLRVVGTGMPQPDPKYVAQMEVLGGRNVAGLPGVAGVRQPAGAAVPGFVPAVPAAPPAAPAPKPDDPAAKKKADEKQAAKEKAARDLAAMADFWKGIEKKAEQAVLPKPAEKKADAKPAAPAAPPIPLRPLPAPNPPPVQLQVLRVRGEYAGLAAPPAASNTILLAPLPGKTARTPADTTTAVKIEALPNAADHRGSVPADTLLVLLQAMPEPKLGLEQVTDVRVTRAVADTGRELVANKLGPAGLTPSNVSTELALRQQMLFQQKMLLQQRAVVGNVVVFENGSPVALPASGRQTLLRLKATADGPVAKLAELSGVLIGVVRTPPSEVVAVDELYPAAGPTARRGHQGATLRAAVTDENIDDTFTLDVVLAYATGRIAPAAPGRDEALISDLLAKAAPGQPRPAPAPWVQPAASTRSGVLLQGLVLTDAAGVPFRLTASSMRSTLTTQGGERVYVRTFRITAVPTAEDQGKPAKLGFYGTWQKAVEVPFTLKDVPVAAGAVKR